MTQAFGDLILGLQKLKSELWLQVVAPLVPVGCFPCLKVL